MQPCIIILISIHDAASYLAFIRRVCIRVHFRSCPVYPLAPVSLVYVYIAYTPTACLMYTKLYVA